MFMGQAVPEFCVDWRFNARHPPRQLPWEALFDTVATVSAGFSPAQNYVQGIGYVYVIGGPPLRPWNP